MKTAQELYQEKKMSAEQVLDHIQSKDFIVCAQAAAEPAALLQKMEYLKTTGVQDVLFSSCVPAQDYSFFHDPEMKGIVNHASWFFSAGLLQAGEKQSSDEAAQRTFFEGNLNRIPSGWRIARQKAEERGDTVRLVQEDVKLAAIDEVWQLFHELWG